MRASHAPTGGEASQPRRPLDVSGCRETRNYSIRELVLRVLWAACGPAFRWSPRLLWGWRSGLLRLFGAKVGSRVRVDPSVRVFAPWNLEIGSDSSVGYDVILYNLGPISIGDRVTISQRAHLCAGTHDYTDARMPLQKVPIAIGDEAWVCADAFVGPGVHIGPRAVAGARAVVMRDVPEAAVVAGNPARVIKCRTIS
jgi:putative colanic acid biosynthesis acetyltransferase WcaF